MRTFLLSFSLYFLLLFIALIFCFSLHAQENSDARYATMYLNDRTSELDKYLKRSKSIEQKLLRRLKKKEERFMKSLEGKDSLAYQHYLNMPMTYDSISSLSLDIVASNKRQASRNPTIDSLKGIQQFIVKQSGKLNTMADLSDKELPGAEYASKIAELESKLNAEQQIRDLIQQRSQALEQMAGGKNIACLQSIQKEVYYAKEKMKAWRELADDPDKAEEQAMEYLQGVEGFGNYLNANKGAFGGLGASATAADLQSMGYQTKDQMGKMLQEKFGGNLQAVQQSMGKQVQQFSEKLNEVNDKVNEGKAALNEAKLGLGEAKAAKDKLKRIEKPSFKKNPERAKPFLQRLETQYNFQTTRATPDGLRPAMLELGASVAFKHTPKLSYGIGVGTSIGLGPNWQNIKLSYEGVSTRAYADWLLIYGFSAQVGYEQIFRPVNRPYLKEQADPENPNPQQSDNALKVAFGGQQHVAYAGIMKRYRISNKWSGTFLAGYNFLWRDNYLKSPFILRFGWGK
ncbi:hypothetical protein [Chitinophaga sp. OAE865]|uniref:hypothetical protein n=1 Tax=Chitinophaga sp. OAE865 TaxID=2817898 RepID=UPI001AEB94D0